MLAKRILHWKLRNDPRIVVMEETNARFVESLPEAISIATIDASFISLKILLPAVKKWLTPFSGSPPIFKENGGDGGGLSLSSSLNSRLGRKMWHAAMA